MVAPTNRLDPVVLVSGILSRWQVKGKFSKTRSNIDPYEWSAHGCLSFGSHYL